MAASEPSGSTGVQPSAEAKEAAYAALTRIRCRVTVVDRRESDKAVVAAYAIDAPAIHAAGVQEGRAAMLREVVETLRAEASYRNAFNWLELSAAFATMATDLEARFPSEGTT